jgi:transcriptional regulator with PAS, ATPase and Fis domain
LDSALKSYPFVYSPDSPLLAVYRTLEKVLEGDTTVLIEGESGAGKDALAQWLHYNSTRKHGPFIKIDLGSLPEELVESELFGYERGAFTGAINSKLGKFDLAQSGSVVLDEIANVEMRVQAKLLNVVEVKQLFRLGGTRPIDVDCRIIALSSVPLARAVERKTFRQDLFFRLNLITIRIPPLRERRQEVVKIAQSLLGQLARKYNIKAELDRSCETVLGQYEFPGNIRELRNGLERALLISTAESITPEFLPAAWSSQRVSGDGKMLSLEDIERNYIAEVLKETRGKKVRAARILGISRKTLLEKRKKYGMS